MFANHYQPRLPADLGFYDLRVPEVRMAQAEMAREHGIEAFCYWHYWFAGKRLLERPFNEVLCSGQPDFPFCLAWANASWTGIWHGQPDRVLIAQTYPGRADYKAHFDAILPALTDERYLTVEGKPLFVVYLPDDLPDPIAFTDCWRELALQAGLKGLYLVGHAGDPTWNPGAYGFDAAVLKNPRIIFSKLRHIRRNKLPVKILRKLSKRDSEQWQRRLLGRPTVYQYADALKVALPALSSSFTQFPTVIPNWDNTPRSGLDGVVLQCSTPALFQEHLQQALQQIKHRPYESRILFIKSWNEWAEGNYLEPDQRFGRGYLEVVRDAILAH